MLYDIAIIGAGASGLMAASKFSDQKVCIIEKNSTVGAKIKVSGGGKCNITNKYLSSKHYLGNEEFIKKCFLKFDNHSLLKFLNQNGIFPTLEEKIVKGTYFCKSSSEPIRMFEKLTHHAKFFLQCEVFDVVYSDHIFKISTSKGKITSKKLIVASGGLSYATLGASDIGFTIAKKFRHTINTPSPALVGFTVQKEQFWFKELSGVSLDAKIKVEDKTLEGKLLFTHKGCSGPVILSTSLYWKKGNIVINFAPYKHSYLPKRFKQAIKNIDIDIHNYSMAPAGNFGYSKAEVTKGGIEIAQLTETFESIYQKDLYFIGEVVDITGELGGYNFQWALSSGYSVIS